MVKFNSARLAARTWAIPGLCGLFVLHHDFTTPRLTRVTRMIWRESEVEVTLQYGLGNASGPIAMSIELLVILYSTGAVGITERTESRCPTTNRIIAFLAGDIAREASRWAEVRAAWHEGTLDDAVQSIVLSLVSAAAGIAIDDMQVEVAKDRYAPALLHGVQLKSASLAVALLPLTACGVSMTVNELASEQPKCRHYAQEDVRDAQAVFPLPRKNWKKRVQTGLRMFVLLPLDFLFYLLVKIIGALHATEQAGFVDYLPSTMLDSDGGEILSALSNSPRYE